MVSSRTDRVPKTSLPLHSEPSPPPRLTSPLTNQNPTESEKQKMNEVESIQFDCPICNEIAQERTIDVTTVMSGSILAVWTSLKNTEKDG